MITIFNNFCSMCAGRKDVLMSVKDFYNAVTPGSSVTHGVGRGIYTVLGQEDVCSAATYGNEKLPLETKGKPSLLNEVCLGQ